MSVSKSCDRSFLNTSFERCCFLNAWKWFCWRGGVWLWALHTFCCWPACDQNFKLAISICKTPGVSHWQEVLIFHFRTEVRSRSNFLQVLNLMLKLGMERLRARCWAIAFLDNFILHYIRLYLFSYVFLISLSLWKLNFRMLWDLTSYCNACFSC